LSIAGLLKVEVILHCKTLDEVKVIKQFSLMMIFKLLKPCNNMVMNKDLIKIFVTRLRSVSIDTSIRSEKQKNTKVDKTEGPLGQTV